MGGGGPWPLYGAAGGGEGVHGHCMEPLGAGRGSMATVWSSWGRGGGPWPLYGAAGGGEGVHGHCIEPLGAGRGSMATVWSAVECQTRNEVSPGSNRPLLRFEDWAFFSFSPLTPQLTQLY